MIINDNIPEDKGFRARQIVIEVLPYSSKEHPGANKGEEEKYVDISPLHVEESVENI